MTPQPERDEPFLPKAWLQRYSSVCLTRYSDGRMLDLPVGSSILSLLDFNPRWFVDRLVESGGRTLFTLGLDMTNSCTDACPMCFTKAKRVADGPNLHLDVDLALHRMRELKRRYPDTFRLVMMSGSGEPLNLPGVEQLLDGVADLGLAIRVYTAGKRLNSEKIRKALLRSAVVVRVSLDAVDEPAFRAVHRADGLAERLESLRCLIAERDETGSRTLIGAHFVIQQANWHQITAFADQARRLACDFVSFSQETYGIVAGGFTVERFRAVTDALAQVESMHCEDFGVIVPSLTARPTVTRFDKNTAIPAAVLDRCHHSRQHVFFGVRNDFCACCLAGMDGDFHRESRTGPLREDDTMESVYATIEHGVGTALGRPAKLSCNACMMNGYNRVIDRIFEFLDGQDGWSTTLIPYAPAADRRHDDYTLTGTALSVEGASRSR